MVKHNKLYLVIITVLLSGLICFYFSRIFSYEAIDMEIVLHGGMETDYQISYVDAKLQQLDQEISITPERKIQDGNLYLSCRVPVKTLIQLRLEMTGVPVNTMLKSIKISGQKEIFLSSEKLQNSSFNMIDNVAIKDDGLSLLSSHQTSNILLPQNLIENKGKNIYEWKYIFLLFCICLLLTYVMFKYKYNNAVGRFDVIFVVFLMGLIVILQNHIVFAMKTALRIEQIAFFSLGIFLITKIKTNKLRKLLLFFLVIVSISDFIAIKVQGTHLNYAFFSNIDFSIVPILFSVFLNYTVTIIALLGLAIFVICKYECKLYFFALKNFKKMYIPLIVFMSIAFMPNGVLHNVYLIFKSAAYTYFANESNIDEIWSQLDIDSKQYKKKNEIIAQPGKNIVVIYVESLEKNYLDDELFPGLTPNLNRLKKEWNYYDNYNQIYGTGWTAGALYATQTGFPALFGLDGNGIFQNAKVSNVNSIGSILEKAGYREVFLTGTDLQFAGTGRLMHLNGYETFGLYNMDSGYSQSEWGVRDLDLFKEAKKKYTELSLSGQPFNLTVLTVDTHFPEGMPDERLRDKLKATDRKMGYAIASIDYILNDFISFLKQQENYKDLAIYILPDHLVMGDETVTSTVGTLNKKQRQLFLLTNQNKILGYENLNRVITYLDLPKVILNGAQITHNATFLNEIKADIDDQFISDNMGAFTNLNLKFHYMEQQSRD